MKQWSLGLVALVCTLSAAAQRSVVPYHLVAGLNKTSNIIFPFAITSVDRGSNALLVQKAKGVDNILQVKAAKEGFAETNLSVVTSDGKFYSFVVDYTAEPQPLNVSFVQDSNAPALNGKPFGEAVFGQVACVIAGQRPFLHTRVHAQRMGLWLQGIWMARGAMWFDLGLYNHSMVRYNIDYVRFFIRDKKTGKRTAVQQKEVAPLYSKQGNRLVYCFAPFTISPKQELVIQVAEKNGGRALVLHVGHKVLLKARKM